jgi:hypothetical protein
MLLRKTLASLLITLSAVIPGTIEAKASSPTKVQCKEIEIQKSDLQLRIQQGLTLADDVNYSGMMVGFRNNDIIIKLGLDEERTKERKDDELELVGLRIEGRETLHRYKFWFGFGGTFWDYNKPYVNLQSSLHVAGGAHFEMRTLKPESSSESLPTEVTIKPFMRIGGNLSATYPLSHITDIPIIRNFEAGISTGGGYQNIGLFGTKESEQSYYLFLNGIMIYSL